MGMYDTIQFNCPDCGDAIYCQSKGGECVLELYQHYAVPPDVASDANTHAPFECKCGSKWEFANIVPPDTVSLGIRKVKE